MTGARRALREGDAPMFASTSVAGNVAWTFVGTSAFSLAQLLVIVVLARAGNPSLVGQYALGLAIGAPVVLLASLALRTVHVTEPSTVAAPRFGFADYLALRVLGMLGALAVIVGVAAVVGSQQAVVIVLIGLAKALDAVGDIFLGLFQRHEQMKNVAISLIVNGVSTVAATTVLLALTGNIVWAVFGSVVGSALGAVAYCVRAAKPLLDGHWAPLRPPLMGPPLMGLPLMARRMADLAAIALPLGLASSLASLTTNVPRYLVGYRLDVSALGIFAVVGCVLLAGNTVYSSVAQTMLPRMTRLYAGGDIGALRSLTTRLVVGSMACGGVAAAIAAAVGGHILGMVYGAAYASHAGVLTVFALALTLSGVLFFVGTALSATRRFGTQLAASVGTLVLTGAVGWVVVPRYGLVGAAWLVVLALGTEGALKGLMLRRALTVRSSA